VGWEKSGWPSWEVYRPIAEAALRYDLGIVPASLSREEVRSIRSGGLETLPERLRTRTGLDEALAPQLQEDLAEEIREGHCRILPERAVPSMMTVQRARDAKMASRLLEYAEQDGAILIAGSGHVRRDRGVPSILVRHVASDSILTLSFREVVRGETDPNAVIEGQGAQFDLIWFTPRLDEHDPCERYRERLEQARDKREEPHADPQDGGKDPPRSR
jgi:uncharacterized iron-regulated protein